MTNSPSRYRDPRPASLATIAVLGAGALADAYGVCYLALSPGPPALPAPFPMLHILVRLATVIVCLHWFDRIYGNLPELNRQPEHQRIWAVLGAVVPPFCFFRPAQIVDEVWRDCRPAGEEEKGLPLIWIWWALLWLAPAIALLSRGPAVTVATFTWHVKSAYVANLAAAIAGIIVVHLVGERQSDAASEYRRMKAASAVAEARARRMELLATAAAMPPAQPRGLPASPNVPPVPPRLPAVPFVEALSPLPVPEPDADPDPFAPLAPIPLSTEPGAGGDWTVNRPSRAPITIGIVRTTPALRHVNMPQPQPAQRPQRTTAEDLGVLVSAISAPAWIAVLVWSTITAAFALLIAGLYLLIVPNGAPVAAFAFLALGTAVAMAALVVARQREPRDLAALERWRGLAVPGVFIAILNILAVMGLLLR
jgi:hypothetical protein